MNMNNNLDLSSLREELEKQKKERERLITENALAEVKHKAALEEGEGEQSPSSEEAQAVSVNAVPDDVLMNGEVLTKLSCGVVRVISSNQTLS